MLCENTSPARAADGKIRVAAETEMVTSHRCMSNADPAASSNGRRRFFAHGRVWWNERCKTGWMHGHTERSTTSPAYHPKIHQDRRHASECEIIICSWMASKRPSKNARSAMQRAPNTCYHENNRRAMYRMRPRRRAQLPSRAYSRRSWFDEARRSYSSPVWPVVLLINQ